MHSFIIDHLQFVQEKFKLGSNKIHPNELIDVLKLTVACDHVTTKFEYGAFTYLRLCSGIERIFDPHFLQPTIRLHMLSTAMTNDVVGGGGILTPAFQKCWLQSGWLFCDVNGNQGLMTVARRAAWLSPWLAGRWPLPRL